MSLSRQIARFRNRAKNKDFLERKKKFQDGYEELVRKYKCDWQGTIAVVNEGKQAVAQLSIYDISEALEEEREGEEKQNQALKNMSLKPDDVSAQARIEVFLRVKQRLPNQDGDDLTIDICKEFIKKFDDNKGFSHLITFCRAEIQRMKD